jgi:16S rRNA (guanine527-N7)-methyltransferase
MKSDPRAATLKRGLDALNVPLDETAQQHLLRFLDLLAHWNRAYNLTAVRDPTEMVTRHLLDSLSVLPTLHGKRVLDIGTGAGLPGMPLAIARPELDFTLIDGNAKKIRFVTQACLEIPVPNAHPVHGRVEQYAATEKFDTLLSRAVGSLGDLLGQAAHQCARGGRFVVMKGELPMHEISAVPAGFRIVATPSVRVPGLDAARHLVILERIE